MVKFSILEKYFTKLASPKENQVKSNEVFCASFFSVISFSRVFMMSYVSRLSINHYFYHPIVHRIDALRKVGLYEH
ncbi:hypothetical protein BLOT_001168 [Blomia tropicalis]|nr:hypothetical protein BLOT_001168 [Blomia tropicalis]